LRPSDGGAQFFEGGALLGEREAPACPYPLELVAHVFFLAHEGRSLPQRAAAPGLDVTRLSSVSKIYSIAMGVLAIRRWNLIDSWRRFQAKENPARWLPPGL
jgi:hypothetical protein